METSAQQNMPPENLAEKHPVGWARLLLSMAMDAIDDELREIEPRSLQGLTLRNARVDCKCAHETTGRYLRLKREGR